MHNSRLPSPELEPSVPRPLVSPETGEMMPHYLPPSVRWGDFYTAMCLARVCTDGIDIADGRPKPGITDNDIRERWAQLCNGTIGGAGSVNELAHSLIDFPKAEVLASPEASGLPLAQYSAKVLAAAEHYLPDDQGSLIGVDEEVLVPGGRFRALFIWDLLPVLEGAVALGEQGKAYLHKNLNAMLKLSAKLDGNLPNVNATWGAFRAHPFVAPRLVRLAVEQESSQAAQDEVLFKYQPLIEDHIAYLQRGMDKLGEEEGSSYRYMVRMANGRVMYRPYDEAPDMFDCLWRDEMLTVDLAIKAAKERYLGRPLTPAEEKKLAIDIRSGAGTGEDFTGAQCEDHKNIYTIHTTDLVSVKMNALLYDGVKLAAEMNYRRATLATDRGERTVYLKKAFDYERQALELNEGINESCISADNFPADHDFVKRKTEPGLSMTGIFALSSGIIPQVRGEQMLDLVDERFVREGGFINTLYETDLQWDGNAWPIMEIQAVQAAARYGRFDLALKWAKLLIHRNETAYARYGVLFERFDPDHCGEPGNAGEYKNVVNLLMSHGQHLALVAMLPVLERMAQERQDGRLNGKATAAQVGRVAVDPGTFAAAH